MSLWEYRRQMRSRIFNCGILLFGLVTTVLGQTQLLQNGDFTGTTYAPWILSGGGITGILINNGLSMGNVAGASQAVFQTVTLPSDLIQATLRFNYATISSDTSGSDTLKIYITDTNTPNPDILATLGTLYNGQNPSSGTFSGNFVTYTGGSTISAYAGRTVNVYFFAATDPTYGGETSFDIDDVTFVAGTTANIPINDNFSNATVIPAAGINTSEVTTYASKETGEPNDAGNAGGRSVWFTWTATSIGAVRANTITSGFTTLLGVYTGTNVSDLTSVIASNGNTNSDGQAAVLFDTVPGQQYYFCLDGWDGEAGEAVFNMNFTDDKTPPTVAFISPAAQAYVTTNTITVRGTAHDNVAVASVQYRLENASVTNAYQLATGTTSWSAVVSGLIPGPNIVDVEAIDTSSNVSAPYPRTFNYAIPIPLALSIVGDGHIVGATNGELRDLGFKYSLIAEPAVGFRFTGWTGSITTNKATINYVMASNLNFTANFVDIQKPTVTVTAPLPAARTSNGVYTITGKAKDNVGVASVWYELDGGPWTNPSSSNQWTNWSATVNLNPGTNQLRTYAEDAAGNHSPTNVVNFTYILSARLDLVVNGSGIVSPNYSNTLLQIGRNLSMVATARAGYVFSNWTDNAGTVITNGRTLKFTMASNLVFAANFVPNPFPTAAGSYQGLFYNTTTATLASSGFVTAQVTDTGRFTGRLLQGAKAYALIGQFSLTGGYTNTIKAWDDTVVALQLDLDGGNVLNGNLTNPGWTAELTANRAVYSRINPASGAGKYTLVLPAANSPTLPGGNGFGSLTVGSTGALVFSGTLGDGTKITQSTFVSDQDQWPFYASLYNGTGMILGWLNFTNEPSQDIDGLVTWFKPAQPAAVRYPAGFTNQIDAIGSAYAYTPGSPVLNLTDGSVILENGDLPEAITNQFVLASDNIVTGSNKLALKIAPASGLFQGSTTNSLRRVVTFSGVVLQKQTNGFGEFLGTNQSGSVLLQ
jgi:hypothetical protein